MDALCFDGVEGTCCVLMVCFDGVEWMCCVLMVCFDGVEWMLGVDRLSVPILSILPIIDISHSQNRFAD